MTKRNAVAFEVPNDQHPDAKKPGAYWFMRMPEGHEDSGTVMGIQHACPCGCGQKSVLFFKSYTKDDDWTVEKPFPQATLSPSIGMFRGQNPYHWHGYLRNGVFEEC